MPDTKVQKTFPRLLILVGLVAAQTVCSVAYHGLARWLGLSLDKGVSMSRPALDQVLLIPESPAFWLLVLIEGLSFGLWMMILARIDLARAFPLTALSYCLILAVGHYGFHEPVNLAEFSGSLLILGGILLLATGKADS